MTITPTTSLAGKGTNIAAAFTIKIIMAVSISALLTFLNQPDQIETPDMLFFMACVWAPIWEETIYRWAPITIAQRFEVIGINVLWPVILISSAIFGWGHGEGPYSLLHQGVSGIIYSVLYLKNGNSLLSSIVLHSMWNTFVIFVL